MTNMAFFIIARNKSNHERIFKIGIDEWHQLLNTICPRFGPGTKGFDFDIEDLITDEEEDTLDLITYDETAVSISEGYEELKEANFVSVDMWLNIFRKVESEYFKIESDKYIDAIIETENSQEEILKVIRKTRVSQIQFDQIKQSLIIAKLHDLEVAFTVADY
ncbi:MAG: hypothetical protein ACJATI_005404 [Halioglobus sp.]|jgi:hypothetical protein